MLQNIRDNSQGTIAKIIVGFIIVTFALFGIESIVALGNSEPAPVTVNGVDIEEMEILRLVEMQKNRFRQQFGDSYDESLFNDGFLRQSAVEQLIEQKVAVTQARELGAYVSTQSIDQAILAAPEFQQDGQFSSDRFKMILRRSALTPLAYRAVLEEQSLVTQLQLGTGLTDTALPFEIERQLALSSEQRDYEYVVFNATELKSDIEISDEQINNYYDANKDRFQTQQQVAVDYVVLNKADLRADIDVDEEEIDFFYQEYLDQINETEERKSSHILIEITDERNEDAAEALAQQLSEKARAGEDFAALAKEYSDDIGSKNLGGDLGFNTRGGFIAEFDDALFVMKEGEISSAVQTEFGYHVIKLDAIRKPAVLSRAEKEADIITEIKASQLTELFAEQTEALAAAAFENDTIENLVANNSRLGLKAQNTGLFSRSEGKGIAINPAVRTAAFDEKVSADRELSDIIEISADQVVVIGLSKLVEPEVKPLAQVKAQIESLLLTEKANQLATEKAESLIANIATDAANVNWVEVNAATFSDAAGAPAELNTAVFTLPKKAGELTMATVASGRAVARLKAVSQEIGRAHV